MWKKGILLEDKADRPSMRRHIDAGVGIRPGVAARPHVRERRAREAGDGTKNCGLAAARRSEDRQDRTRLAGEVDVKRNRTLLANGDSEPVLRHDVVPPSETTSSWP